MIVDRPCRPTPWSWTDHPERAAREARPTTGGTHPTNRQIAEILHLAVKTVESHRAQLINQLGTHGLPGLVKYAIRHGIISVNS